jgi:hypothetical protein
MSRAGDLYERLARISHQKFEKCGLVAGGTTSGLMIIALQRSVCAQDNLQAMSDDELAEYFMVKEWAADLYLVCTDRNRVKDRYRTLEVRRNAYAINQNIDLELYTE